MASHLAQRQIGQPPPQKRQMQPNHNPNGANSYSQHNRGGPSGYPPNTAPPGLPSRNPNVGRQTQGHHPPPRPGPGQSHQNHHKQHPQQRPNQRPPQRPNQQNYHTQNQQNHQNHHKQHPQQRP